MLSNGRWFTLILYHYSVSVLLFLSFCCYVLQYLVMFEYSDMQLNRCVLSRQQYRLSAHRVRLERLLGLILFCPRAVFDRFLFFEHKCYSGSVCMATTSHFHDNVGLYFTKIIIHLAMSSVRVTIKLDVFFTNNLIFLPNITSAVYTYIIILNIVVMRACCNYSVLLHLLAQLSHMCIYS